MHGVAESTLSRSGVDVGASHDSATRSYVAHLAVGSLVEGALTGRAHSHASHFIILPVVVGLHARF